MAKLPEPPADSLTVAAIYKAYEEGKRGAQESAPRSYLGASSIGGKCMRALWYGFRHTREAAFPGRILRLFDTGNHEEPRLVADLRAIGCEVHEVDEDGEQFGFKALSGHFGGHMDGCVRGLPEAPKTWHVVEFKTASDRRYKAMKSKGIKSESPEYYAQVMVYMHLSKMRRAIIILKNKNTDELHSERIRYDKAEAEGILDRAKFIIQSARPPEKINENPASYDCKYCTHKTLCHGSDKGPAVPSIVSCRNCVHSTAEMDGDGRWSCAKHKKDLSLEDQKAACQDHLFIPDLINFAEQMDADEGWISYRGPEDREWKNGKHFHSSEALTEMPKEILG